MQVLGFCTLQSIFQVFCIRHRRLLWFALCFFCVHTIKITLCLTILFVEISTLYLREWDARICCSREGRSVRGRSIRSFKKQPPLFHILSCIKSTKIFLLGHFSFSASTGRHSKLSFRYTSARGRFKVYLKLYGLLICVCKRILYQKSQTAFLITQNLILLQLDRTNTVECQSATQLSVLLC